MRIAYCDCFSGISGDMFLGSLVSAGVPLQALQEQIDLLHLPEKVTLSAQMVMKGAIQATQVQVHSDEGHHHRTFADITRLIGGSGISEAVKQRTLNMFRLVAEAEGHVHGVPADAVHFHEVGALDSIADLVCAAFGLDWLGIDRLYSSALPYGSGQIKTQHGLIPLPAPATLEILARAHAPLTPLETQMELVTPTGAAILAGNATFSRPQLVIDRIGIGAGGKDLAWPNVLRLWVGKTEEAHGREMVMIETNIDDMNPEFFGQVMAKLFEAGARDVYYTPVQMKKNRPGTLLSVLALRSEEAAMVKVLFENTTTLGLRVMPVYRYEASREFQTVETRYGAVKVKVKVLDGRRTHAQPEYEDCLRIANALGIGVMEVYLAALSTGREMLEGELAGEGLDVGNADQPSWHAHGEHTHSHGEHRHTHSHDHDGHAHGGSQTGDSQSVDGHAHELDGHTHSDHQHSHAADSGSAGEHQHSHGHTQDVHTHTDSNDGDS